MEKIVELIPSLLHKVVLTILYLFAFLASEAQDEYAADGLPIKYQDYVYTPNLKTVRLFKEGDELSFPIVHLGKQERLLLDFDDLDTDYKNYYYSFIHCTWDWKPTDMATINYIGPFQNDQITNYQFSMNTIQRYTHYKTVFPNNNIRFKKSGNYLLVVYHEDAERVVITRRFYVWEDKVSITGNIVRASIIERRNDSHEIDFSIVAPPNYPIINVWEVNTVLMQNYQSYNAITNLKPMFVNNGRMDYNYDEDNNFYAGNEFRIFDTKTIRFNSINVNRIAWDGPQIEVWLNEDNRRSHLRYDFYRELNGMYFINRQEGGNPDTDCDYTLVHFTLNEKKNRNDGYYYVYGGLTDWQIKPEFKMKFDDVTFQYKCTAMLKQGLYNYQYVFVDDKNRKPDAGQIEGSHWETNNSYTLFVYNKEPGLPYDRLIGIGFFNPLEYKINR